MSVSDNRDAEISQAVDVIRGILRGDLFGFDPEDALTAAASATAYVGACGGLGLRSFLRICGRSFGAVVAELNSRARLRMDDSVWGCGGGGDPLERVIDEVIDDAGDDGQDSILAYAWRVMDRVIGPQRGGN